MRKLAAHVARVAYDLGDLRAPSIRQMWMEMRVNLPPMMMDNEGRFTRISIHICRKERDRSAIWVDENSPN